MDLKRTLSGRPSLAFMVMLLVCLSSSCGHKDRAADSKLVGIFSGFTFVGSAPYSEKTGAQITVPPHGQTELPLPSLSVGQQYIFHHRRPLDDEQLALTTLPAKLKAAGSRVIAGPNSAGDLMFLVYGGPLFKVQFENNGRKGFIFNRLCPQLMQAEKGSGQWVEEDYVLAVTDQH